MDGREMANLSNNSVMEVFSEQWQVTKSIRTADECFRAKFNWWLVVRKEVLEDYVDDIGGGV